MWVFPDSSKQLKKSHNFSKIILVTSPLWNSILGHCIEWRKYLVYLSRWSFRTSSLHVFLVCLRVFGWGGRHALSPTDWKVLFSAYKKRNIQANDIQLTSLFNLNLIKLALFFSLGNIYIRVSFPTSKKFEKVNKILLYIYIWGVGGAQDVFYLLHLQNSQHC